MLNNFCLSADVRKSYDLLQFMDFVTALFALWVTILAVGKKKKNGDWRMTQ